MVALPCVVDAAVSFNFYRSPRLQILKMYISNILVPAKHRSFKSGKLSKLLRAEEVSESLVTKDAPRYQFPPKRLTSSQRFSDLDHFIESDSSEYKWSGPESELESRTADGNIGNLGSDDRTGEINRE